MNPINEQSLRYSPHGKGYVKVYRKLLTSSVFESPNLLKVWIWCLIRANWTDATAMFEGREIQLERGQFITGRFTGAKSCNMVPGTFYKNILKLKKIGNIMLKSDNKKTLVTVVNYSSYQDEIEAEWQQSNNKVTTEGQQSNTDKEYKNIRSKEYVCTKAKPQNQEEYTNYFLSINGSNTDAEAWFDYFEGNGWKTGKNQVKDWKATARTWMRNKGKFSGNFKPSKSEHQSPMALAKERGII
jgi:hypothetical protein